MSEDTKVKQDLIDLANNLDSAKGVILIKGINIGDINDLDMLYHEANPMLAFPALLATLTDVYETALINMEFGLAKGNFSKEEVVNIDSQINSMLLNFHSVVKDLYKESLERRKIILHNGIVNKEVEKEEKKNDTK